MPKPAKSGGTDSSGRWLGAGGLMKRFIKVRGQLMYLYRAVDGQGNTVECLSQSNTWHCGGEGLLSARH